MLGIGTFMRRIGNPFQAERMLMSHFAEKQQARTGWDRQYAYMVFALKWDPVFHRHLEHSACSFGRHNHGAA